MVKLHRNSQKRYYIDEVIYFITTNTFDGFPYFNCDVLCELFIFNLSICQKLKRFELHGYKINPEHIHLLIQPVGKYNYSEIIHSLKRCFTRDANFLMSYENDYSMKARFGNLKARFANLAFGDENVLLKLRTLFIQQYGKNHNIPQFKWQSSFYDHIIRNEFDYFNHLQYIKNQWIKHDLKENKWCWINDKITT